MRAVPSGLNEFERFKAGLLAQNPLEAEPGLPLDLEFAIEKVASLGGSIEDWKTIPVR